MKWVVSGHVRKTTDNGFTVHQVPTFLLDGNIQGIMDAKHAEQIAKEVINPTGDPALKVYLVVASAFPE